MRSRQPTVTLVIPCFNEEKNIPLLVKQVTAVLKKVTHEIIFVDDGSVDNTLRVIESLAKKNADVRYLSFSRNFGHQAALKAGIDHANGKCVISMDADLQHPPSLLPVLIKEWEKGYEIVYTVRQSTADASLQKKVLSSLFYRLFRLLGGVELEMGAADFRLLDQKVVKVIRSLPETVLFLRGMISWIGFKKKAINYTASKRLFGKSKYTFQKMLLLAISGITSYSIRPLYAAVVLGIFFSCVSGMYALYAVVIYIFFGQQVLPGWASIITSILFIGGVQLCMLGVLGIYIGNMYIETKKRPLYIVKEQG